MCLQIIGLEASNDGFVVAEDNEVPTIKILVEVAHSKLNRHQFAFVSRVSLLLGLQCLAPHTKRTPGSINKLLQDSTQSQLGRVSGQG